MEAIVGKIQYETSIDIEKSDSGTGYHSRNNYFGYHRSDRLRRPHKLRAAAFRLGQLVAW